MPKTLYNMVAETADPQDRLRYLSNHGNAIEVDPNQPVTRYYRSGTEMLRMANVYLNEGNYENAFILYMKYMTLFIEKIRTHPDFSSIKSDVKKINKRIKEEIMPTTEKLRAKLLERYEREYEQYLLNKEAEKARELQLERAKELMREKERLNRQSGGNVPTPSTSSASSSSSLIPANLHVQMDPSTQPTAPDMSLLDKIVYPNDFPSTSNRGTGLLLTGDKNGETAEANRSFPQKPSIDRSQKPQFVRSDSLLAGSLRTVVIPQNTMDIFLQLAQRNTQQNIETCGILAGHLARNQLYITHVIIPKQQGTPDSCNTMQEEEIFDVQDQQNLITLGWIHTHPSQTAFLSSVDLHTHCSYQMMMPEAIAIVCAPKYQTTGFFILTPNYGLDYIAQCRQTGFHPHPKDPPLFMDAQHIHLDPHTKIDVVDLRR